MRKSVSLLLLQSREIGAAAFKARCLEIMDEVDRSGIEVVITKHRRPVARLVPVRGETTRFCGALRGMVVRQGDLIAPDDATWDGDERNFA
ncbi:MAG: type II toxin-antitoxin system Phd/YefM family antitoxin [Candidatus Baltobacteraceae bacterium]